MEETNQNTELSLEFKINQIKLGISVINLLGGPDIFLIGLANYVAECACYQKKPQQAIDEFVKIVTDAFVHYQKELARKASTPNE